MEAKEWNVVLPDELEAGADGTRMSDECVRGRDDRERERTTLPRKSRPRESRPRKSRPREMPHRPRVRTRIPARTSRTFRTSRRTTRRRARAGRFSTRGGPSAGGARVADFRVGTRDAVVLVRRPGDGRGGGGGVAIRGEIGEIGARSPTPRRGETRGGARGGASRGEDAVSRMASSRRRSRPAPRDSHRGSFEEHARGGALCG